MHNNLHEIIKLISEERVLIVISKFELSLSDYNKIYLEATASIGFTLH